MAEQIRSLLKGAFHNGTPLSVELLLETSDPLTVRAIFRYKGGGANWDFAYTLFEEVIEGGFAESNDSRLTKESDKVRIRLDGMDGVAELLITFRDLQRFLEETQVVIRRAVDQELKMILEEGK